MYADVVLEVDHYRFEEALEDAKQARGCRFDTDLDAAALAELVGSFKTIVRKATGKPFPQDPKEQLWGAIGAVFGSWETHAGGHLPPAAQHPGRHGHRRQRPGHGVRQHGRRLRHRRRLHPQPLDRRARLLRRVPDQRPGRGRGRRHPHAAAADPRSWRPAAARTASRWKRRCPRHSPSSPRCSTGSRPLPRDAGHRVHHPARQALHPADPHRQADGAGGAQDRRRHGGRRADHPGRGDPARRSGLARPAAPSRPSTPRPSARSSPRACPPRRARSRARWCSAPTTPSGWRPRAKR